MNCPVFAAPLVGILLFACQSALPVVPPPLVEMEEPLELFQEPADETQRQALPPGAFSGIELAEAPNSLDSAFGGQGTDGLEVIGVIQNSPAARAQVEVGDLLLEATVQGVSPETTQALRFASDWRALELAQPPGTKIDLLLDRAGRDAHTVLVLGERSVAAERTPVVRFREEQRAGIVVRTASEVEARAVGLAPGAGAVIVGLSRNSPWRPAGLRFGDLVSAVDDTSVAHPQVLLDALRSAEEDATLKVTYHRPLVQPNDPTAMYAGVSTVEVAVTQRARALRELDIPLLFHYQRKGQGRSHWSALLGALRYEHTPAAWRFRLLWLFRMGAGDTEQLLEVSH